MMIGCFESFARLSSRAGIDQSEERARAIIQPQHPIREVLNAAGRFAVSRHVIVMKQAGGVVVLVARPTAVFARACVAAAVCPMGAHGSRLVMVRVPEQPTIVGRLV